MLKKYKANKQQVNVSPNSRTNINTFILTGVTGAGKTKRAVKLATTYLQKGRAVNLISIDSRKAYKLLNIGTNKYKLLNVIQELTTISKAYNTKLNIFGIDLFEVTEEINVFDFTYRLAKQFLKQTSLNSNTNKHIKQQKPINIIFGGSLLYLKALTKTNVLENPPKIASLRGLFNLLSINELQELAKEHNIKLNQSDFFNKRRLIRYLEIFYFNNPLNLQHDFKSLKNINSTHKIKITKIINEIQFLKNIYLTEHAKKLETINRFKRHIQNYSIETFMPQKILSYEYIFKLIYRVLQMLQLGLLAEYSKIRQKYGQNIPALQIMGYKEITVCLNKNTDLLELRKAITYLLGNNTILLKLSKQVSTIFINNYMKEDSYIIKLFENQLKKCFYTIKKEQNELPLKPLGYIQIISELILSIFKKHYKLAKYQKNSIKMVLN